MVLGKIIEGKMISFGDEFCLGRGACPVCPECIEGKRHRIRPDLTNGGQGSVVADGYAETPRPPLPLVGNDRQECLSHGAIRLFRAQNRFSHDFLSEWGEVGADLGFNSWFVGL